MKNKSFKWIGRLVDKITNTDCPNNNHFYYYGREVILSSGTRDYVSVTVYDGSSQISFSFDFWTKELCLESYESYEQRDVIIAAFKNIYNGRFEKVTIEADEPWDEEARFYKDMIGNDDYDQEQIQKEWNELLSKKIA